MSKQKDVFKEILEEKARKVNKTWVKLGKERKLNSSEKKLRKILITIAIGVVIADIACLSILFLMLS